MCLLLVADREDDDYEEEEDVDDDQVCVFKSISNQAKGQSFRGEVILLNFTYSRKRSEEKMRRLQRCRIQRLPLLDCLIMMCYSSLPWRLSKSYKRTSYLMTTYTQMPLRLICWKK